MTDIIVASQGGAWRYDDHILIQIPELDAKQHYLFDDENELTFEPIDITFSYRWRDGRWGLIEITASGPAILSDGSYDDYDYMRGYCKFWDPIRGASEREGRAPEWLHTLAERRVATLPLPYCRQGEQSA